MRSRGESFARSTAVFLARSGAKLGSERSSVGRDPVEGLLFEGDAFVGGQRRRSVGREALFDLRQAREGGDEGLAIVECRFRESQSHEALGEDDRLLEKAETGEAEALLRRQGVAAQHLALAVAQQAEVEGIGGGLGEGGAGCRQEHQHDDGREDGGNERLTAAHGAHRAAPGTMRSSGTAGAVMGIGPEPASGRFSTTARGFAAVSSSARASPSSRTSSSRAGRGRAAASPGGGRRWPRTARSRRAAAPRPAIWRPCRIRR